MKKVSIFEGKNKFSELINNAANGEPQVITKNGKEAAVIISFADYKKFKGKERPLVEFLLDNPFRKYGIAIDLERSKEMGREIDLFGDD